MFSCVRVSAVDGENEKVAGGTSPSTPKEKLSVKSKKHNNPFSARGLDRFAVLLTELQARRQKIISQLCNPQANDVTVRFAYSNRIGWVPVVIKQSKRPEKQLDPEHRPRQQKLKPSAGTVTPKPPANVAIASSPVPSSVSSLPSEQRKGEGRSDEKAGRKKESLLDRKRIKAWACNGLHLVNSEPLTLIALLLLCLVISGKAFAVLFTVFWWYLGAVFRELDVDGSRAKTVRSVGKKRGRRYQVACAPRSGGCRLVEDRATRKWRFSSVGLIESGPSCFDVISFALFFCLFLPSSFFCSFFSVNSSLL